MTVPTVRRGLRRALIAGAIAIVAAIALGPILPSASAQFGGQSGFAEAFQPDFLPRDMALFNEHLGLEDWQRPIVEMLLEDYGSEFRAGTEAVRDRMRDIAQGLAGRSNADVMELVMGPVQAWMAAKRQLSDAFLNNVQSQLSDQQRQRWPSFERALRRDKQLPRGELSGESANLVVILRDMPLDAETRTRIQPTVDRYTVLLDEALQGRENVIRSVEDRLAEAMKNMDFDAGLAATDQIMSARIAVRTVQDQSAMEIESALPTSLRDDFQRRHRQTAYAKIFRAGSQMDRFFESVRAIADLRPDQISAIDTIETGYYEQVESINVQMIDAIRTEEPQDIRRRVEVIRARTDSTPTPTRDRSRSSELMLERDAAGEQARRAVLALLGPEQVAELPSHSKAQIGSEPRGRRANEVELGTGGRDARRDGVRDSGTERDSRRDGADDKSIGGSTGAGVPGTRPGGVGDRERQRKEND